MIILPVSSAALITASRSSGFTVNISSTRTLIPSFFNSYTSHYDLSNKSKEWIEKLIATYQEQLSYGAEIVPLVSLFFTKELQIDQEGMEFLKSDDSIKNTLNTFLNYLKDLETFTKDEIFICIKETQKTAKVKGKLLYMPIRIATTGIMHGPDLAISLELLGKDTVLDRLNQTIQKI